MAPRRLAGLVTMSAAVAGLAALCGGAPSVAAPETRTDLSVVSGREILADNGCNGACHQARVAGADPMTLYTRSTRRVNSPEELRRQVEMCVSLLNAPIFPEDVGHIVKALDHDAYRFDWEPAP